MPVAAWHFPTMSLNADASGPRAGPQSAKNGRTTRAQPRLQVAGRPELQSSVDGHEGGSVPQGGGRRRIGLRLTADFVAALLVHRLGTIHQIRAVGARRVLPNPGLQNNAQFRTIFLPRKARWELPFRDREAGVVLPGAVEVLPPWQGAGGYSQRHRAEAGVVRLCSQRS